MYVGQWGFNIGLAAGTGGGRWVGEGPHSWGREGLWFGFGGYRPVVRHEDVHVDVFRNAYMDRVRPPSARTPEHRTDVVIHNVYEKRKDVHFEAPIRRSESEIARGRETPARETPARGPQNEVRRGETPRNDVLTDRSGNVYRKTLDGWETRDGNQWKPSQAPRGQETARGTEARTPARGTETPSRGVETPSRGDERTARGPERGNQTPARGEDRAARGEERPPRGTETPGRSAETPARGAPERRGETPTRQPPPAVPPAKSPTPSNQQNPDLNRDYRSRIAADDRLRHYETPSRSEPPPSRSESPSRSQSPARNESPARSEPPARSSGRDDSPSRSGSNGRGNSNGR
jgi:hypothetical protein